MTASAFYVPEVPFRRVETAAIRFVSQRSYHLPNSAVREARLPAWPVPIAFISES